MLVDVLKKILSWLCCCFFLFCCSLLRSWFGLGWFMCEESGVFGCV